MLGEASRDMVVSKIGLGATVGAAALALIVLAGASIYQVKSANPSPEVQRANVIDINKIMQTIDPRALREESWPAV